jgi:hypothetical protein
MDEAAIAIRSAGSAAGSSLIKSGDDFARLAQAEADDLGRLVAQYTTSQPTAQEEDLLRSLVIKVACEYLEYKPAEQIAQEVMSRINQNAVTDPLAVRDAITQSGFDLARMAGGVGMVYCALP